MSENNEENGDIKPEKQIFHELKDLGICNRCTVRFLCNNIEENYLAKPEDFTEKFLHEVKEEPSPDENVLKKLKLNPCIVCLDIFSDGILDDLVVALCTSNLGDYKHSVYSIVASLPKATYVRSQSVQFCLKNKFPESFKDANVMALNKFFRAVMKTKLTGRMDKTLSNNVDENLVVKFELVYDEDETELKEFDQINTGKNSKRKNCFGDPSISRKSLLDTLPSMEEETFKKLFKIPPGIPLKPARLKELQCTSQFTFLGGRYIKHSRKMGQTPWIIDGVPMTETCVQDIIFNAIKAVLNIDNKMTFSASGREDSDVRMLGSGRPFYIQVDNPQFFELPPETCKKIEEKIAESSEVFVLNLQTIHKKHLSLIKDGEQSKKKTYVALCKALTFDAEPAVSAINSCGSLEIRQRTPVRVVHRRTMDVRTKVIYNMNAKLVLDRPGLFELRCVTQAGTYVKEFVHGDFGRTKPSLRDIIDCSVDILALDVADVDLEWPVKETN